MMETFLSLIEKEPGLALLVLVTVLVLPWYVEFVYRLRKQNQRSHEILKKLQAMSDEEKAQAFKYWVESGDAVNWRTKLEIIETFRRKNAGFVSREFLLVFVPAVIALSFTAIVIYLHYVNSGVPDYKTPELFSSGLTTIIGYYFGVGVGSSDSSFDEKTVIRELRGV